MTNILDQLQRDLNRTFGGRIAKRGPAKTRLVAIFPTGQERDVRKGRDGTFRVTRPDGRDEENNMLRDLKIFLAHDFPGVRFERRPA